MGKIKKLKKIDIKYIERSIDHYSTFKCNIDYRSVILSIIRERLIFPEKGYNYQDRMDSWEYNYKLFESYVRKKKLEKLNSEEL